MSVIERRLSAVAIVSSIAYSVNSSITYKLKAAIKIHRSTINIRRLVIKIHRSTINIRRTAI